jgi:hypothetical protein
MSFAAELQHALTHDPAAPPARPHPTPRVTATVVYEPAQAIDTLVATARSKGLFARETWTRMQLPGASAHDQFWAYLRRRDATPVFSETAVWVSSGYFRILTRETPTRVFSVMTLGRVPSDAERLELFRALWDCGIESFYGYIRKDHPILQFSLGTALPPRVEPCPIDPDSVMTVYPVDARGPRP